MAKVKKVTGKSEEVINIDELVTVQDFIINNLCQRYKGLKSIIIDSDGSINKIIAVFVNNRKLEEEDPVLLSDGDEIAIVTPIAGG
jgi:molybdopterin converting factor small subunit